jgi:hypothetical protein
MLVSGEVVAAASSESWPARGVSMSVAIVTSRTVDTVPLSRLWTDYCRACWRGLDANADCSRTRISRNCCPPFACLRSVICRACGPT